MSSMCISVTAAVVGDPLRNFCLHHILCSGLPFLRVGMVSFSLVCLSSFCHFGCAVWGLCLLIWSQHCGVPIVRIGIAGVVFLVYLYLGDFVVMGYGFSFSHGCLW